MPILADLAPQYPAALTRSLTRPILPPRGPDHFRHLISVQPWQTYEQ